MSLHAQLKAARAQVDVVRLQADVLATVLDALLQQVPQPALSFLGCQHPDEARVDAATLTHPRRIWCRDCQTFSDTPLMEEGATRGLR